MAVPEPVVKFLGRQPYDVVLQQMREFTDTRDEQTPDEFWLLEHEPVFTQGQAGKVEHLLDPGDIPVVQSDRGGQVTYHGPGQLVCYLLVDIKRLHLGVRQLVDTIEQAIIEMLADCYHIEASDGGKAPGVYIEGRKLASLGLRIRKGCSYHGLSLNVDMDLEPFQRINPCGFAGLEMVQLKELGQPDSIQQVAEKLAPRLIQRLYVEAAP